ncbi:hypothetical protein LTR66_007811 [Elasticomyces elasticus]|nr:hypothetical protein LTR66_007811 [Elasticomyces elasticus]
MPSHSEQDQNVYVPRMWPAMGITALDGHNYNTAAFQASLEEPAYFYMRSFSAASALADEGYVDPKVATWLRSQTVKFINEALSDPKRATSDALIVTVGRIALHEHLFGDRHAAEAYHRPAQHHMVQMRGGLEATNLTPLVNKLLRWADRVMSLHGGAPEYFPLDPTQNRQLCFSVGTTRSALDGLIRVARPMTPKSSGFRHTRVADVTSGSHHLKRLLPGHTCPQEAGHAIHSGNVNPPQ